MGDLMSTSTTLNSVEQLNPVSGETPPTLASVGSEGERSEPERTTGANVGGRAPGGWAGTTPQLSPNPLAPANPEVVERPLRRTFTADYKRGILAEADAASDAGAVGRILRREGLYSSHLASWRKVMDKALEPNKRGPKSVKNPLQAENVKLMRENARLQKKLRKAELIIDLQKKLSQILGVTLPALEESEDGEVIS